MQLLLDLPDLQPFHFYSDYPVLPEVPFPGLGQFLGIKRVAPKVGMIHAKVPIKVLLFPCSFPLRKELCDGVSYFRTVSLVRALVVLCVSGLCTRQFL